MQNKKINIIKIIAIICGFFFVISFFDGVLGGSSRDGSVHPPVECKALPLKIFRWIVYGGIPFSAIALLCDEELKFIKKRRTSRPYMRLKYFKYALFIFLFLLLTYAFIIRYIGIWDITHQGKLQFELFTSWKEVLLVMMLLYCPRFCILSLSVAYILQLWHEISHE